MIELAVIIGLLVRRKGVSGGTAKVALSAFIKGILTFSVVAGVIATTGYLVTTAVQNSGHNNIETTTTTVTTTTNPVVSFCRFL